jgi:hypothetical protein
MGREFVSEARQTYVPSGLGALDLNSFLAAGWLAKKCISFNLAGFKQQCLSVKMKYVIV